MPYPKSSQISSLPEINAHRYAHTEISGYLQKTLWQRNQSRASLRAGHKTHHPYATYLETKIFSKPSETMKKFSIPQQLLQAPEIQEHLKDCILSYAERIEALKQERDEYIENSLEFSELEDFAKEYRLFAFRVRTQDILPVLERQLRNMCWELRKAQGKLDSNSRWQEAYRYATEEVTITNVIQTLVGIPEHKTKRAILCPFHDEKTPSFKIYPKTNSYCCFGCQKSGKPVNFVMELKNCNFKEAVHLLANI